MPRLLAAQLRGQPRLGGRQHRPGGDLHRWRALWRAVGRRCRVWVPHAHRRLLLRMRLPRCHLRCLQLWAMVVQQAYRAVQTLHGRRCCRRLRMAVLRGAARRRFEPIARCRRHCRSAAAASGCAGTLQQLLLLLLLLLLPGRSCMLIAS